ncbi:hypothetical protein Tco_0078602 [Tanacetum coccineum]
MMDVFDSMESELDETLKQNENLKDRLLEATLVEDARNLVITSCVEIENKNFREEIATATRNKGKEIARAPSPPSESEHEVSLQTHNNNLRSSSNTRYQKFNNSLRVDKRIGDDKQTGQNNNQNNKVVAVTRNRDALARECRSTKRVKDSAYHKDKMLLCEQEEAKMKPLDPSDKEPLEQVHNNDEYNVFAMEKEHPEKPESINDTYVVEQGDNNITPDSSDMSNNKGEVD